MGDSRSDGACLDTAYRSLVTQARQPAFYRRLWVPDTIDGRFDLLALHLVLVQYRLRRADRAVQRWVQRLMETFVTDMDRSLREMGIGDLKVGGKVHDMLAAVRGRYAAYGQALEAVPADPAAAEHRLRVALDNNLYGTVHAVPELVLAAMAAYVRDSAAALAGVGETEMVRARFAFPPPPETDASDTIQTPREM